MIALRGRPGARRSLTALGVAVALLLPAGCSDGDGDGDEAAPADGGTTTSAVERPEGPAADVAEVLEGGDGTILGSATSGRLPDDWVEEERMAAGTAASYRADGDLPEDGRFELAEAGSAEYRTRIVVRRPERPEDFNGTVVVEWLNVSGGLDAAPDYS
ncbi:MAG TPA: alpha/beta hydrolase domain-containing protein, partial [Acidimicrobiales bacterium]|nr:alpha/beta hydrolase domain-containing protein [Acidimicrobiales bacterium]